MTDPRFVEVITCHIDSSGLSMAKAAAMQFSTRTPAQMTNTTGLFIAKSAWSNTPVTPIGTIDTELAVLVTVSVGPRGGKKKSASFGVPEIQRTNRTVALAFLIIAARANANSNYNQLTGGRFQIHDLGKDRLSYARRMLGARHSSTHFVQSGWIQPIIELEKLVPKYARRGSGRGPSARTSIPHDLGSVTPAQEGSVLAVTIIENKIGMSGHNAILDQKRNAALWRVGAPALQAAIDAEHDSTMRYVHDQSLKHHFKSIPGLTIDI